MKRHFAFKRALETFEMNPYRLPPLTDADIKHLRRWSQDSRCEELWQRLSGPLFARPEGDAWYSIAVRLINVVLAIRNEVESREKLAALKKSGSESRKAAALSILKKIARAASAGKATDHPAVWRERARLFQQAADFCTSLISHPLPVTDISVDRKGSLKRQRFSARLSEHLHLLAGRWCDAEVATLTEIAFPGKEITTDIVRAARRRHPSS
jgi:hypothetical protein